MVKPKKQEKGGSAKISNLQRSAEIFFQYAQRKGGRELGPRPLGLPASEYCPPAKIRAVTCFKVGKLPVNWLSLTAMTESVDMTLDAQIRTSLPQRFHILESVSVYPLYGTPEWAF